MEDIIAEGVEGPEGDEAEEVEELTLERFLDLTQEAHEKTRRELTEIQVLVKQSGAEVERLAQRNRRVANYMSHLHTNFDTIPREDIKEGYEALINAQQRLFTMRGQLEKLQSDQRNLERLAEFQQGLLEVTSGLSELPEMRLGSRDQTNIIRVIQTEEAARQSLVRRMHDGPASSLSNFILQAEICQRFFDLDPGRAREELDALKSSAASTFSEVKSFIFDLRPMMLDDLGVVPTLRRYVDSVAEKYDIEVSIAVTGRVRRLKEHHEVTIFRAIQELLNNARVHGQATEVQIIMDLEEDRVTAVVKDNGSGFNVEEALSGAGRHNVGLPTLRNRIEMLGGELEIESTLGQGTQAGFSIPVQSDTGPLIS